MTLHVQFTTLFMMFCGGLALGAIYDLFRVLHRELRLPRWSLMVIDTVYWIVATILIFRLLYQSNHGQIRLFVFIGLVIGVILYYFILSRLVVWTIELFIRAVKWLYKLCVRIVEIFIIAPLVGLYRVSVVIWGILCAIAIFLGKIVLQLLYPFWRLFVWMTRPIVRYIKTPVFVKRTVGWVRNRFRRKDT
ncbi:spore cortex biosynthesis protein YabQ [Paenibacillus sp. N1-5-1-14]|uniref:spore cortex biosynthesis protein YabQ n=1 Tax=Paenibacillus radicibacter TaxID=2972488 RepID=UPI002159A676|nr:spore cortex biosynthesis protein YabQ [Paenibacillus radicibacter]MCR8645857.1 spore cortex biosynthesis protein YabQ [Paenibacillus radicibacter]